MTNNIEFNCRSLKGIFSDLQFFTEHVYLQNMYFVIGYCPNFGQDRVNFVVVNGSWRWWVHLACYSTPLIPSPGGGNKGFALPRRKGVQEARGVLCLGKPHGTGQTL